MAEATLQWAEDQAPAIITSRAELEERLRGVAQRSVRLPVLATLSMPDGGSAHVGLGRDQSIVILHGTPSPDGMTLEWISVGDVSRTGVVEFFLLGQHHSEFEERSLLPFEHAIEVLGEFFETGSRSQSIQWEENSF
jgi:hypothetical protein